MKNKVDSTTMIKVRKDCQIPSEKKTTSTKGRFSIPLAKILYSTEEKIRLKKKKIPHSIIKKLTKKDFKNLFEIRT